MPIYTFNCSHKKCGRRFEAHMALAAYMRQKGRSFIGVQCPKCETMGNHTRAIDAASMPKVSTFNGVFDSSDNRHPPDMDGIEYTSRKDWERKREANGIILTGGYDPLRNAHVRKLENGKLAPPPPKAKTDGSSGLGVPTVLGQVSETDLLLKKAVGLLRRRKIGMTAREVHVALDLAGDARGTGKHLTKAVKAGVLIGEKARGRTVYSINQ